MSEQRSQTEKKDKNSNTVTVKQSKKVGGMSFSFISVSPS